MPPHHLKIYKLCCTNRKTSDCSRVGKNSSNKVGATPSQIRREDLRVPSRALNRAGPITYPCDELKKQEHPVVTKVE